MSDIGNIHRLPLLELAQRAARRIMETRQPRAITMDDRGNVRIGIVESAQEADLVGVYKYSGLLELTRTIAGDLADSMLERGLQKEAA